MGGIEGVSPPDMPEIFGKKMKNNLVRRILIEGEQENSSLKPRN
jgi:hypothetical protein